MLLTKHTYLNKAEADKVRKVLLIDGALNAKIVGQPAAAIAELAGVKVPADTKVLVGEGLGKVSYDDAFRSRETISNARSIPR